MVMLPGSAHVALVVVTTAVKALVSSDVMSSLPSAKQPSASITLHE
jgi:hypothetical protein